MLLFGVWFFLCLFYTFIDNCYKTKDGTYCAIPFIYKGKTYYECTKNENGIMWCATTSNFDMDEKGADCERKYIFLISCYNIFLLYKIPSVNLHPRTMSTKHDVW